ncbi:26138_t:CDS:2, partial [Dentiscutata erythropus]
PSRMDFYNYHLNTDWNMDNDLYWGCDVEKCEYWDLDVEFLTSTKALEYGGTEVCNECWDIDDQKWIRVGIQSVALKTINNPIDPISDLLNEIESNIQVVDDPHFIRCLAFDKFILPTSTLPSYKLHSEAIYTSRLFNTTSSKPVNASNSTKIFSETTKSTLKSLCEVSKSIGFSKLLSNFDY